MKNKKLEKILLIVGIVFGIAIVILNIIAFFCGAALFSFAKKNNNILETAQVSNISNKNQNIELTKRDVEMICAQYSTNYYTEKSREKEKIDLDLQDYIAKQIGGEITVDGFEITTCDRDITVSKDDITFEGTINDKGLIDWKDIEDSDEIEKNEISELNEMEKDLFNANFLKFEGELKSYELKMLISRIKSSNQMNEDRKIKVKFLDKTYKESEFEDLKELIESDKKYEVDCEENSDGIIYLIEINEL